MAETDEQISVGEIVDAVHLTKQPPRFRTQSGRLVKYASGWHCRYYDSDPDVNAPVFKRKRVKAWLCTPDTEVIDAQRLMAKHMAEVNSMQKVGRALPSPDELTVGQFWVMTHLKHIKENRSWSTSRTYERLWKMYLKPHFDNRPLRGYSTPDGNAWLTSLVKGETTRTGRRLNASSYRLVRSVASGIFTHALNLKGILPPGSTNPFQNVRVMVKIDPWVQGEAYSQEEAVKMLKAFDKTETGPKLFFAIAVMQGLGPSEVAGLRFDEIDLAKGTMKVMRSCPNGHVQEMAKNDKRKGTIPLSAVVVPIFQQWCKECEAKGCAHGRKECETKGCAHGFVFQRRAGQPVDYSDFDRRFIAPVAERAGVEWHGVKAARRTYGTQVTLVMNGDSSAAHNNMRNTKKTAEERYVTRSNAAGRKGQRKYDTAIGKLLK
jgi:integrase